METECNCLPRAGVMCTEYKYFIIVLGHASTRFIYVADAKFEVLQTSLLIKRRRAETVLEAIIKYLHIMCIVGILPDVSKYACAQKMS